MIEGEGLGGFARRVTVNDSAEGLFRPRRCFFFTQIAELPENSKAASAPTPDGFAFVPQILPGALGVRLFAGPPNRRI